MTTHFDDYDTACAAAPRGDLLHACLLLAATGLSGESFELDDCLEPLSGRSALRECGDCLWYIAYGARSSGHALSDVAWQILPGCGAFSTLQSSIASVSPHSAVMQVHRSASRISALVQRVVFYGHVFDAPTYLSLLSGALLGVAQASNAFGFPLALAASTNVDNPRAR